MKFSAAFCLTALLGAVAASPLIEAAAELEARQNQPRCDPGRTYCTADAPPGGQPCRYCAILVGDAQGNCRFSNRCANRSGSCREINGQAYCT